MHIYDFITDEFHFRLKETARNRPHPIAFEWVLKNYIEDFKALLTKDKLTLTEAPEFLHPNLKDNPAVNKWLGDFQKIFLAEADNIKRILDECLEIYHVFIRGKQHNAVLRLHDLLDRYNLLDKVDGELLGGFFRCRKCANEADTLGLTEDFFLPHSL